MASYNYCHDSYISAGIDQTLANRCKPQAASMAKLKEMRHTLKQVIFTGIRWHQVGKIQNFKENADYEEEGLVHVPLSLS